VTNPCIDLRQIGAEGIRFDHPLRLGELKVQDQERILVRDARLRGSADPDERGLYLTARLDATVDLSCCRCLDGFEKTLGTDFVLIIVPDAVEFGAGDSEVTEEDSALFYARDGRADLGEIAREQVYLNLPLKPVCRPRCRGLCPTCGVNRNRIECDCGEESVDPRLAPLLEFKKHLTDS